VGGRTKGTQKGGDLRHRAGKEEDALLENNQTEHRHPKTTKSGTRVLVKSLEQGEMPTETGKRGSMEC